MSVSRGLAPVGGAAVIPLGAVGMCAHTDTHTHTHTHTGKEVGGM